MMNRLVVPLALLLLASGCAMTPNAADTQKSYDLGLSQAKPALPPLRIAAVRASAPFDGTAMIYRLAFRDAAEVRSFAQARWAATPAELVRKELQRAMRDGRPRCGTQIEVQEMSQVFSSAEASEARIELVMFLGAKEERLGSRAFRIAEPGAGAGAASGAAAMQRALARAIGEVAAWVAQHPVCAG